MALKLLSLKIGSRCVKRLIGFVFGISISMLMFWHSKLTLNFAGQSQNVQLDRRISNAIKEERTTAAEETTVRSGATKLILLWTRLDHFYFNLENEPLKRSKCTMADCAMTTDRSLLRSSDVVVFNFRDVNVSDLPGWRSPEQRWIFYMVEPAEYTNLEDLQTFNGKFNWTMTYRLDSDIHKTYGWTIPKNHDLKKKKPSATLRPPPSNESKIGEERHLAVWMVSHCHTKGQRERYVEELSRHVPVDIYGACAKNESYRTCPEKSCGVALYRSHKFYLAFENSVCRDYVTEKFFKALRHHVVPVVYGGANYTRVAPPGSYVDVRDFDSPRHLAEHLKALDANDAMYEKYLQWTEDWKVVWNWETQHSFCYLCAALHSPLAKTNKVYDDIATWWAGEGVCGKIKTANETIQKSKASKKP